MSIIVSFILLFFGTRMHVERGKEVNQNYGMITSFLCGVCVWIAVLIWIFDKSHMATAQLLMIVTIILPIKHLLKSMKTIAAADAAKLTLSAKERFMVGPIYLWWVIVMAGVGKVTKLVMYFTIIGIPLWRAGFENNQRN